MKRRDFIKYAAPLAVGAASLPLLAKLPVAESTPRSMKFSSDGGMLTIDDAHHYKCMTPYDISTAVQPGDLYVDTENQVVYVSRKYIRDKLGLTDLHWIELNGL